MLASYQMYSKGLTLTLPLSTEYRMLKKLIHLEGKHISGERIVVETRS